MATLLLISPPDRRLTYENGDVVSTVASEATPGRAVIQNSGGDWSFLYVTDKEPDAAEITDLLTANTTGSGEDEEFIGKRRYFLTLPGDVDTYTTYASFDEASEDMKMTWSEISPLITDKQG